MVHSFRKLSRRTFLAGGAAGLLPAALSMPAIAQKKRRKVIMVYGVPTIESSDTAFFSSIPMGAGFYADAGLDVELRMVNGAASAVNMLATGQADFTTHGGSGVFAGVGRGAPIKAFIVQVPDQFTSIGVLDDSTIRSVEDLKGKTVGLSAMGGGPAVLMNAICARLGWKPGKDISFIAVGSGMPALDALQKDRVHALFLWDAVYGLFEANGAKFRYFRPDPLPSTGFQHTTNVSHKLLESEPETVAAISRALGRSLAFMAAVNPSELTKLHFKVFPNARSAGLSDEQLQMVDRKRYEARAAYMRFPERIFQRSERIGDESEPRIRTLLELLEDGKEIPKALPTEDYFTRHFISSANDFDFEKEIASARKFVA